MKTNDTTPTKSVPATREVEPRRDTEAPAVDVCEDARGVRIVADMPGVPDTSLVVSVENEALMISGTMVADDPEKHKLVGREYRTRHFTRTFSISDRIDTAGITATMKDGVLTVALPKKEAAVPRRIEIAAN